MGGVGRTLSLPALAERGGLLGAVPGSFRTAQHLRHCPGLGPLPEQAEVGASFLPRGVRFGFPDNPSPARCGGSPHTLSSPRASSTVTPVIATVSGATSPWVPAPETQPAGTEVGASGAPSLGSGLAPGPSRALSGERADALQP